MGLKELMSQRLFFPLVRCTMPMAREMRPIIAQGLRVRREQQSWLADRRDAWALEELRRLLRHAGARVPYYRDLFRKIGFDPRADFSFDDYAHIPALDRTILAKQRERLLSEGVDRRLIFKDSTGGSTGEPAHIWKDVSEKGWGLSGVEFFERQIGVGEGRRIVRIWGHHLDLQDRDSLRKRVVLWLSNVHYLDCFRMSNDVFAEWHAFLSRYRPEVLVCYASAIYLYADWLRRQGLRPGYPSRAIITGAEKLWSYQRAIVEQVFSTPVHERYGGRDIGLIAFQRAADTPTLEVDWANILVEPDRPLDATGHADLLITKLHSYAMPLLRYRNGDMAHFPDDAKPGRPAHILIDVSGRTMDRVVTSDGRVIHAAQFPHMFKNHDIQLYQVYQHQDHSVIVRIVPGPRFGEADRERIEAICRANLGETPLQIELTDQIVRTRAGKLRPVISEVATENWGR